MVLTTLKVTNICQKVAILLIICRRVNTLWMWSSTIQEGTGIGQSLEEFP
jgi:hypothetical protein